MALTPDTSNRAFLREVDEEVRRERIADLWARYSGAIVVGIVALLALVAAGLWWHGHRETARGIEGERLQAAFDKLAAGDTRGASVALAPIAADGGAGYRALARMTEADILIQRHDVAGAARSFAAIAADDGVAKPFRDLALVRGTAVQYDLLKPDVVVQRLRGLAVQGQPFFGTAGEMVGLAYLHMNRRDLATTLFTQIAADEATSPTIRQRAVQMASVLTAGAIPQAAPQAVQSNAAAQNKDKPAT